MFRLFDFDDDGRLQLGDFKEVCSFFLGSRVPAVTLHNIWEKLDSDGDGFVCKNDFVKWLTCNEIVKCSSSIRTMKHNDHTDHTERVFGTLLEVYHHLKSPKRVKLPNVPKIDT